MRWWQPLIWLIYPAAYLGLAIVVLNNLGRRAPYYFLDPGNIGAAGVAANAAILALVSRRWATCCRRSAGWP